MTWVLVFIGGGFGSICRYAMSQLFNTIYQGNLPMSTFASNVLSCVLLAASVSLYSNNTVNSKLINAALVIGFCGGFSTFSTFSFETVQLIKNGNHMVAVGNVVMSVSVCLILIYKLTK